MITGFIKCFLKDYIAVISFYADEKERKPWYDINEDENLVLERVNKIRKKSFIQVSN